MKYVHIEGMDLSGKTTLARNIAATSDRDWQIRTNSICDTGENPIWQLADRLRISDTYDGEIIGNLYATALMADIRAFVPPTINTIQDSTVALRSLAYHKVRETPGLVNRLESLLLEHPGFDASFYLFADLATRRQRLEKRIDENPEEVAPDDLMVVRDPERFTAMEEYLRIRSIKKFESTFIDTSDMTPAEVLDLVATRIDNITEEAL